jgi:hypothetical protein
MQDYETLPPPNQSPPTQAVTQEDVMQNLPVLNIVINTIDNDIHNYIGRLVVNTSEGWAQVLLQEEGQPLAVVMFMLDKVVKIASHEVQ